MSARVFTRGEEESLRSSACGDMPSSMARERFERPLAERTYITMSDDLIMLTSRHGTSLHVAF